MYLACIPVLLALAAPVLTVSPEPPPDTTFLSRATDTLTTAILQAHKGPKNSNFVFSPMGYATLLVAMYEGGGGPFWQRVMAFLELPVPLQVRCVYRQVLSTMQMPSRPNHPEFKTWLYVKSNIKVNYTTVRTLKEYYFIDLKLIDEDLEVAKYINKEEDKQNGTQPETQASTARPEVEVNTAQPNEQHPGKKLKGRRRSSHPPLQRRSTRKMKHRRSSQPAPQTSSEPVRGQASTSYLQPSCSTEYLQVLTNKEPMEALTHTAYTHPRSTREALEAQSRITLLQARANRAYLQALTRRKRTESQASREESDQEPSQKKQKLEDGSIDEKFLDTPKAVEKEIVKKLYEPVAKAPNRDTSFETSKVLLFNALYFNGSWEGTYTNVKDGCKFHTPAGPVITKCIQATGNFETKRLEHLKAEVIHLRYMESRYSLILILPDMNQTVDGIIKNLDKNDLMSMDKQVLNETVNVRLPKFKFSSISRPKDALVKAGLGDIYDPEAFDVFFFTVTRELYLGDFVQFVSIEVDETSSSYNFLSASNLISSRTRPRDFIVDRPFLFLLRDRVDNFELVVGQLRNPNLAQ